MSDSGAFTKNAKRETSKSRPKAVGLLSGGLDSTLAAKLLQEQGVDVVALHFNTGFCKVDHRRAIRRPEDRDKPKRLRNEALRAGSDLRLPVEIVDVAEEYLREVVLRPKYGYGSAMNPCIDCRIFMLRKAKEVADRLGAEVVFTGEVVGQRPMSQHRQALRKIERDAGLEGRLLRPLSARLLPPTEAESRGLVDRERLGAVHGRSRKEQLRLAQDFGIDEFPTPSGGCCFLADENFARRMRDLLAHKPAEQVRHEDILLLKVGRHVRLSHRAKLVQGRDESEGRFLERLAAERWTAQVADGHGAFGVVEGEPGEEELRHAASLAARYSRHRERPEVRVRLRRGEEEAREVVVEPAQDAWIQPRLV